MAAYLPAWLCYWTTAKFFRRVSLSYFWTQTKAAYSIQCLIFRKQSWLWAQGDAFRAKNKLITPVNTSIVTLNAKSNNESGEEDDYEIENDENYELAQEKRNKVTLYSKNHKQTASSNKVSSSEALNSSVNILY